MDKNYSSARFGECDVCALQVAKKVAQSLYTKKHVRVDDDMVDAPDTKVAAA